MLFSKMQKNTDTEIFGTAFNLEQNYVNMVKEFFLDQIQLTGSGQTAIEFMNGVKASRYF